VAIVLSPVNKYPRSDMSVDTVVSHASAAHAMPMLTATNSSKKDRLVPPLDQWE
jgi:hypothetical protein